jgi:hypothetical protein
MNYSEYNESVPEERTGGFEESGIHTEHDEDEDDRSSAKGNDDEYRYLDFFFLYVFILPLTSPCFLWFFSDEEFDVVEESNGDGEEVNESVAEIEADQSTMMRTKSSTFPTLKQQQQQLQSRQQLDETEYSNDYENAGSSRDEGDDHDDEDEDNESYSRIVYDRPEDDDEDGESVDEGNYKSSKILSFAGL